MVYLPIPFFTILFCFKFVDANANCFIQDDCEDGEKGFRKGFKALPIWVCSQGEHNGCILRLKWISVTKLFRSAI